MHIQTQFRQTKEQTLHELIRQNPLATFVIHSDELVVNHFPLVLSHDGAKGVLRGHIPRSNSLWQALESGLEAVAIFQGPEAYISPSWYPSKHDHGKAVPTWNYVVVHAHGIAVSVQTEEWLLEHLNVLTDQLEAPQNLPWKVADAPGEFTQKMVDNIVGIEMPISSITGKWKISQNRSAADRLGVAAGLQDRGYGDDLAMSALVLNAQP